MRAIIGLATDRKEDLVDITARVAQVVRESGVRDGLVSVYAQGATAAIMIQENWDDSVQEDVIDSSPSRSRRGCGDMTPMTATAMRI